MSRHGTFGTHFIYGNPATSLAAGEDLHVVGLKDGSQIRSRAVIIRNPAAGSASMIARIVVTNAASTTGTRGPARVGGR